jgi:hypothetical protein
MATGPGAARRVAARLPTHLPHAAERNPLGVRRRHPAGGSIRACLGRPGPDGGGLAPARAGRSGPTGTLGIAGPAGSISSAGLREPPASRHRPRRPAGDPFPPSRGAIRRRRSRPEPVRRVTLAAGCGS